MWLHFDVLSLEEVFILILLLCYISKGVIAKWFDHQVGGAVLLLPNAVKTFRTFDRLLHVLRVNYGLEDFEFYVALLDVLDA